MRHAESGQLVTADGAPLIVRVGWMRHEGTCSAALVVRIRFPEEHTESNLPVWRSRSIVCCAPISGPSAFQEFPWHHPTSSLLNVPLATHSQFAKLRTAAAASSRWSALIAAGVSN